MEYTKELGYSTCTVKFRETANHGMLVIENNCKGGNS